MTKSSLCADVSAVRPVTAVAPIAEAVPVKLPSTFANNVPVSYTHLTLPTSDLV